MRAIPGVSVFINPIQNLRLGGRTSKSRYQYVMRSVRAEELACRSRQPYRRACVKMPFFVMSPATAQLKGLQARLNINRDKINLLGVQMADIRSALYSAFGERQVSTIYTSSDSYQVILQVPLNDRSTRALSAKYICVPRMACWCRYQALHQSSVKWGRSRSIMRASSKR